MPDAKPEVKVITESEQLLLQSVVMLERAEQILRELQARLDAGARREVVLLNCVQRIKHIYSPINETLETYRDLFHEVQAEAAKAWELTHVIASEWHGKVAK